MYSGLQDTQSLINTTSEPPYSLGLPSELAPCSDCTLNLTDSLRTLCPGLEHTKKNTFYKYAIIWYYYENIYYLSVNYIYFVTTRKTYFGYSVKYY